MTIQQPLDYLSSQETKTLLNVISDPRDRAIVVLCLSTGIFLSELVQLKADDIDWKAHHLTITGKRNRTIPLNDETYEALAKWSAARPKTPCEYFFLTTKGKVKGLSARGIDHLIRNYGHDAKFSHAVSAQLLRGTFAVRLFKQGLSLKEASKVLGIRDFDSLKRYQETAQKSASNLPPLTSKPDITQALNQLDTRSKTTRFLNTVFATNPKETDSRTDATSCVSIDPRETILGRERQALDIKRMLDKGQSLLITGAIGIGKTHLLEHLASRYDTNALAFERPVPLKTILIEICDHCLPSWKEKLTSRASIQDLMDYLQTTPLLSPPILIIDNLDQLKASDVTFIDSLMEHFTILGATDDKKKRLNTLWWKFKEIPLDPLSDDTIRTLIKTATSHLTINDYAMLENHLVAESNGYPLAVIDMINHLHHCNIVNAESIRELRHTVGTTYRDWTYALVVLWSVIVCLRFIALGLHSFEGYILAGIGTSVFLVVKYFLMRMR